MEFIEDPNTQTCVCKSEKMVSPLTIRKSIGGYIFFEVVTEKGILPEELRGKYSSMAKARVAVEKYFRTMKETVAARRENFHLEREERKKVKDAAKSKSEDNQHLHQGLGD